MKQAWKWAVFVGMVASAQAQQTASDEAMPVESEYRSVQFTLPAGKIVKTPLQDKIPVEPRGENYEREYEERDGQLASPFIVEPGPMRSSNAQPSVEKAERAPETFTLLRNSVVAPGTPNGNVSNVAEPSVAVSGNSIFETYNWFSVISNDNGQTRQFINPYTSFPNTPAAFTAGFCCDQRAAHATRQGLVFWFLQYIKSGATATSTGGVRLAVARANTIANNPIPWQTYDFTPEQLGLTGTWFDFPHMQVSDNYVYFTSNMFLTAGDTFAGAVIFRVPLAQIVANEPVTVSSFVTTTFGSILAINGSGSEGTRAGRNVMWFASVSGTNAVRVLKWAEADAQPTVTLISGLTSTAGGTFTCTASDASNPCGRANTRMQSGWVTDTEVGMMWSSNSIAPARPFPFSRVLIIDPNTLAIVSEPDIFSTTSALLYPAVAVNQRGHLGGIVDNLGGDQTTGVRAFIRDDLSPNVLTNGWEVFPVVAGNAGAPARWGDYNGIATHGKFAKTWVATGHFQTGGQANANARLASIWFARERDSVANVNVGVVGGGSAAITSVPTGINCGAQCAVDFPLGTQVTLTVAPNVGNGFLGWTGACTGTGLTCVVSADDARTVRARVVSGFVFSNGFE